MDHKASIDSIASGHRQAGLLGRLARDRKGNTMALIAASTAPLLALIGGGIDMSRGYLAQTRLQQACDAGVLAARKKLGSAVVLDGNVPTEAVDVGNRFFNLNYRAGAYGSDNLLFEMALEEDYAVSGEASVDVPTTIMGIFGNESLALDVKCEARISYSDSDILFVLDTTGSMLETNSGDAMTRIAALRSTVQDFHTQIEDSKSPGTRVRYGFVPYSTNVNVGHLLEDDWVVDEWTYQSRERITLSPVIYEYGYNANWVDISGSYADSVVNSYPATWNTTPGGPGVGEGGPGGGDGGYWSCNGTQPAITAVYNDTLLSTTDEPYLGPPSGTKTTKRYRRTVNGDEYWTTLSGNTCNVGKRSFSALTQEFDHITHPAQYNNETWRYRPVTKDVSNWRTETAGCMEERDTYEIYSMDDPVDFSRALDLDLDTVPTAGNAATQWRPMYPNIIWTRELTNVNANNWKTDPSDYNGDYIRPADYPALVACPTASRKLEEMDGAQISAYMSSLVPGGQTYHDIGMIWGGRLISPTGLYAAENEDRTGKSTTRHLIFLTDGITEPLDLSYTSYGLEPLDQRRWTNRPDPLLDRTIEMRFGLACKEVKKRNVKVWVIGFGTTMNDIMKECAGDGRWFQADDAEELAETFNQIAKSMAELRVSK
jgi:Putative Flp pilus-assembly TadE/G-like